MADAPNSVNGIPIRLPEERWQHILENHAEFESWRTEVLEAINRPKRILVGLEAGQQIPPHPASMAVYQFLEQEGTMLVEDETYSVTAGSTVIVPDGASRGLQTETRMIFIGVTFV